MDSVLKAYIKAVLSVILVIISYGLLVPNLISARDDFLVISGVSLAVIVPVILFYVWRKK